MMMKVNLSRLLEIKNLIIVYFVLNIMGLLNLAFGSTSKQEFLKPTSDSISINKFQKKHEKIVYGFLPYWTLNNAKYIQLDKVTDIAYFALSINADGSIKKIGNDGNLEPGYNNWKNNKGLDKFISEAKNANVDVALTIISHDPEISDKFLECKECWQNLYIDLKKELAFKDLKSINLDFEYPEYTDRKTALAYSQLVDYLNKQLDKSSKSGVKVIVSTFADAVKNPRVTHIPTLGKVSDGVFIMAYDFHYTGSSNAGPVAPISGGGSKYGYDINSMLIDYVQTMPASKIILGVPYYGYNWLVENPNLYSKRVEGNEEIGFSQSQTYSNIMETIMSARAKILWNETSLTPYFNYTSPQTGALRQVHFENAESLRIKYELVHQYNLKGAGIWALGYDGGYQDLWQVLEEKFGE